MEGNLDDRLRQILVVYKWDDRNVDDGIALIRGAFKKLNHTKDCVAWDEPGLCDCSASRMTGEYWYDRFVKELKIARKQFSYSDPSTEAIYLEAAKRAAHPSDNQTKGV